MNRRHELSDEQWEHVQPLLPPQKAHTGRPGNDHRMMLNGMIWIAKTGAPWRDLPERYGKWPSVYSRFQRWRKAGIWDRIWSDLQREEDAAGKVDWEIHFVDGTVVRAHQHAAGAKKVVPKPKR
jgi:transposase